MRNTDDNSAERAFSSKYTAFYSFDTSNYYNYTITESEVSDSSEDKNKLSVSCYFVDIYTAKTAFPVLCISLPIQGYQCLKAVPARGEQCLKADFLVVLTYFQGSHSIGYI